MGMPESVAVTRADGREHGRHGREEGWRRGRLRAVMRHHEEIGRKVRRITEQATFRVDSNVSRQERAAAPALNREHAR